MEWKVTDYLAIWGAVVATAVALWNIYKDILRDRVIVTAGYRVVMPAKIDVFMFDVTNLTSHKIRVTTCAGHAEKIFIRSVWLHRWFKWIIGPYLRRSQNSFIFMSRNDVGTQLPGVIDPWDQTTFCFNAENLPEMEELFAITADGRHWFCPRSDIKSIQEHRLYRAARASASPTQAA